jgi:hypothetical protein
VLRSPWLGVLAVLVAGVIGYLMSDGGRGGGGTRRIESVTVTIRPTRDTGAGWDFGGGAPDPKITVLQGETMLATCELKDTLTPTCVVGATIDGAKGLVRVAVVDVDSSDSDAIGELVLDLAQPTTTGTGALQAVTAKVAGGEASSTSAWRRFRPLWLALAVGIAVAFGLARYRRRGA